MTQTIFNTMPLLGKVRTIRLMAPMLVFSVLLVMGCSSDDDSFTGGQGEQEMTDSTVIALTLSPLYRFRRCHHHGCRCHDDGAGKRRSYVLL